MDNPGLQQSLENGPHAFLQQLVGSWSGQTKTWLQPDVLADESPQSGTIRSLLNGRFVLHEYDGRMQDQTLSGLAILGYNLNLNQYETAWIDSWHMDSEILFSVAETKGPAHPYSVFSTYPAPKGPPWGWRTEINIVDIDHIILTAYNVTPAGQSAKAVETQYHRVNKSH